ncbi:MAG TPA: 3-phosphoshikimate 1-carboxyvinyltransferase [Patescibacteria group bacterium]|nr:3-phosphoshikimate 1-carboxyvinyltransferase [Patescibacteria group bacterium]
MGKTINNAYIKPLDKPVNTNVNVPGSKSYSQRALLIAAMLGENVKIRNLLSSSDTKTMQESISALKSGQSDIRIHESGLTARFITALACISNGAQTISGTLRLQKRPIKDLVEALQQLGADIRYIDKDGYLPFKVMSSELKGGEISLKGNISSQYLSALLLIAPALKNGLTLNIEGHQISKPYIDMTIDVMDHFGVKVENHDYKQYVVKPQKYQAKDYFVEADYSSASYFYAINKLTWSNIKVQNLNPDSKQGDKKFVDLLKARELPTTINAEDFPDQAMTVAILAAFNPNKTVINGVKSLRIKETERVEAIENELAKMGIKTKSTKDQLTIYGGNPRSARIDTYNDHRLAMSFAVAGTKLPNMQIMNPKAVDKTFPGFWDELGKITDVKFEQKTFSNILLTGMRGSGKSTIGRKLAKKLEMHFIDMDDYIENKNNQKVRDIVLTKGWKYFRDIESKACKELSTKSNCVISSGGGIVLRQDNIDSFRSNSLIILLKSDPKKLSYRIKHDKNRPELSTQPTLIGELGEVWRKRKDSYFKNADFIIETSYISPKQAVNEIMEKLKNL